tara:strand:+ start:1875 stop:2105 length:231 start_codon:yes stop_codon:yes gene_type:complete
MPDYDDVIASTLTRVLKDYLSKWKNHCKEEKAARLHKEKRKQYRQRSKDPINKAAMKRKRLYRCNKEEIQALLNKG